MASKCWFVLKQTHYPPPAIPKNGIGHVSGSGKPVVFSNSSVQPRFVREIVSFFSVQVSLVHFEW
jgi:hypothetical protein